MKNYNLTNEALNDLRNIYWHGIRLYGEARADEYYDARLDKFDTIAAAPYAYQIASDLRKGYRRSVCGVNSIYYRVVDETVEIIRVLGRQDTRQLGD